jgi:hypothetical protein
VTNQGSSFLAGGKFPIDRRYALAATTLTALPGNQPDGTVIRYKAALLSTGAAEDVWWTLTYDAASSYWYVSGFPLTQEIDTAETTASTSYVDIATVGPKITVPFAGDYLITIGAELQNSVAGAGALMSFTYSAAAATDADSIITTANVSSARSRTKFGVAALTTITPKYRALGSGTITASARFINVLPLRVH